MRPRVFHRSLLLGCLSPMLATSCRASPSSVDPPQPLATTKRTSGPAPAMGSAFVVLTTDATLVVPVDPALPTQSLPGHWVGGSPGTTPAAWGRYDVDVTAAPAAAALSLPVCPSAGLDASCTLDAALDAPDRLAALADASTTVSVVAEVVPDQPLRTSVVDPWTNVACECVAVRGLSTDGTPKPWADLEDPTVLAEIEESSKTPEEYLRECSEEALRPELGPVAYLGGVLYVSGMTHNGMCDGLNLYDGTSEARPLRPGAAEPELAFPKPVGCMETSIETVDVDELEGASGCEPDDLEELVTYSLHSGRLVRAMGSIGTVGEECSCASWLPASEAVCPSPLDPCGTGRGLPSRERWSELWVTTDERMALGQDAKGLAVLVADRAEPIRREPAVSGILGVEHHPETALLGLAPPTSIRVAIPPLDATDQGFTGSAKDWGNRCFAHLRAERLDAAEAACFAGLLAGGTDGTRGALTYNLGRIAEARADRARARAYYERSQRLRPNESTAERLRALGRP